MNVNLFKSETYKNGDNLSQIAEFLGISQQTLSKKLHGRAEFDRSEIQKIKDKWKLSAKSVDAIFFT